MGPTDIIVPLRDRAQVIKDINSIASGKFAISSTGHLYEVSATGGAGSSTYYTKKLEEGIASPVPISITIDKTFTKGGNTVNVNDYFGGGLTDKTFIVTNDKNGNIITPVTSEHVVISGDANSTVTDTEGKPLRDNSADILVHELVGHAIPSATKPGTGNAVDDENKVRAQEGKGKNKLRRREPDHKE